MFDRALAAAFAGDFMSGNAPGNRADERAGNASGDDLAQHGAADGTDDGTLGLGQALALTGFCGLAAHAMAPAARAAATMAAGRRCRRVMFITHWVLPDPVVPEPTVIATGWRAASSETIKSARGSLSARRFRVMRS
jgi:hypothetical protein